MIGYIRLSEYTNIVIEDLNFVKNFYEVSEREEESERAWVKNQPIYPYLSPLPLWERVRVRGHPPPTPLIKGGNLE